MDVNERTHTSAIAVIVTAASAMVEGEKKSKKRKKRVTWVKPWLLKRKKYGAFNVLLNKFQMEDPLEFKQFLQMDIETFDELLRLVGRSITKQNNIMRDALDPKLKLAVTICYSDLQHLFMTYVLFYKCTLDSKIA